MARGHHKKRVGGMSYIDAASDEEVEIEAHATAASSSSGQVRHQYSAFRTKISPPKTTLTSPPEVLSQREAQTLSIPVTLSESINSTEKKRYQVCFSTSTRGIFNLPSRLQGASVMMRAFTEQKHNIQAAILSNEYQDGIGDPCPCGSDQALFRCKEDCFEMGPLQCQTCIVTHHIRLPFHHIQEWTGKYFKQMSLHDLGARICLGHSGMPCPNRSSTSSGRPFVIVDRNGFHHFIVEFCHCDKDSDVPQTESIQLI